LTRRRAASGAAMGVFHRLEMRVAVFYPFLSDDHVDVPKQDPLVFRVASFIGAIGSDQLVPGPLLDTGEISDIHELLMLVGLHYDGMQRIELDDGYDRRCGWIGFDAVLSITADIVFALNEEAAREFLLDLRSAAEMLKVIRQNDQDGCMIEIILPQRA
jgi:hypothetical protein